MSQRTRKKYSEQTREERIETLERLLETVQSEAFRKIFKKMLEFEKSA